MRALLIAALLAGLAAPARAWSALGDPWVDVWGFQSLTGGYHLSRTEFGARMGPTGRYQLGGRVRTWRFEDGAKGTGEEYSASLTRELYHATVKGWIGTSPPSLLRAGYHLAGGEGRLTFYGTSLGPEHPELSAAVWESSGPAPAPESLDRTWVTRFIGRYNNIDNHLERQSTPMLIVVENVWQFDLSETWRERTTLGAQMGFDRYNRALPNSVQTIGKDNIDYPGNAMQIPGWPNNWGSAYLKQKLYKDLYGSFDGTRLNLLDNKVELLYGVGLAWKPASGLGVGLEYYHRHRRGAFTREGFALDLSYRW